MQPLKYPKPPIKGEFKPLKEFKAIPNALLAEIIDRTFVESGVNNGELDKLLYLDANGVLYYSELVSDQVEKIASALEEKIEEASDALTKEINKKNGSTATCFTADAIVVEGNKVKFKLEDGTYLEVEFTGGSADVDVASESDIDGLFD